MSAGCLYRGAINYNPSATEEDYSCMFLIPYNGICHLFRDVAPPALLDKSYTMSYSVEGQSWVFYHDYIPDIYFHTREQLYSIVNDKIYRHNAGNPGTYYSSTVKPFFVDIVFKGEGDMLLESVQWVSEFLSADTEDKFTSLSHLSIWNGTQHSGRIPLTQLFQALHYDNIRRTKGQWAFDDFKDALKQNAGTFLKTIFEDFALDSTKIAVNPAWYEQGDIQDSWFCVRFEFDNLNVGKMILHEVAVEALKSDR